jgi:hypothetical protein
MRTFAGLTQGRFWLIWVVSIRLIRTRVFQVVSILVTLMRNRITRKFLCWSFAVGCTIFLVGCNSGGGTTSGTSGGPGYLTVPLAGWWSGGWSRNTTLTDIIVDTADVTTQLDPLDGVARLQITSASGSSQTISGSLLMTGFECFTSGTVSGSWSGSNIGMTVTDSSTPVGSGTRVASITVTNAGTSYQQSTTTVALSAPDTIGGAQATATATVAADNTISGFVITNPGSGYNLAPGITITDSGGGTGAVGTAVLDEAQTATALSLSGHQTSAGELKFAYTVASGKCEAKRGSITLNSSG